MTNNSGRFSLAEYEETINAVLDSGGEFTLFPRGTSMLPLIVEGRDSVTLIRAPEYHKGDIAFYKRENGGFVLHRIIAEKDGAFTMCGDNQLSFEQGIKSGQIIAKVKHITRKNKKITADKLSYRLYLFLWRSFFIRRVYFKLRRIFHGV